MTTMRRASYIAHKLAAIENCRQSGNREWEIRHTDQLSLMLRDHLPSGSGFDNGTELDFDNSTPERLVFTTAYHHMDDHGGYTRWTEHEIIVTPSLVHGFKLRVTGPNHRDIKTYIAETFCSTLHENCNLSDGSREGR